MPPKNKQPKKVYDYSGLEAGMRVQIECEGSWFAGDILQVSTAKNRTKAPVKVTYKGYVGYDEWVGGERLRSKALKVSSEAASSSRGFRHNIKAYYTFPQVPNPMLVDIFAREKGIDLTKFEKTVDLPGLDCRKGESNVKNPAGQLPYIELNDGSIIAETIAICEYLEEAQPSPAVIGATPKERAEARMWQRRMEEHFVYPCFNGCRFASAHPDYPDKTGGLPPFKDFFKERATPENGCILIPDAYKGVREWSVNKLKWLEAQKKDSKDEYVCGNRFTVVDIQMYTTIKFFGAAKEPCLDEMRKLPWLSAWYDRCEARPTVKAATEHSTGLLW